MTGLEWRTWSGSEHKSVGHIRFGCYSDSGNLDLEGGIITPCMRLTFETCEKLFIWLMKVEHRRIVVAGLLSWP